ncbi:MAG: transcription termination factor NusA [Deltaproteobacteria bacterium]|nr:transcription termination factor NusA [Deltaproteobacteria bacterium]
MLHQGLARVIEQVAKDRGMDKKVIIQALEAAFLMAAKKKYGLGKDIEAQFNEELDDIELFQFKTVVETVEDPTTQILLQEARKLDAGTQMGDSIGVKLDSKKFGRIDAQTVKQVILQKVFEAERDMIYNEYISRKGEIISGIIRRFERGNLLVDLGKTEALVPQREQIPGEVFRNGDRIQAYILDVQDAASKGAQVILSRSTPLYLIKLFEMEVPEVSEGIVIIKGAAREPGFRAKIAVYSKDSDVDAVGACVGVKGTRVQNVVQELRGEKIDIVPWSGEDTQFVVNALAPAEISKVIIDDVNHSMEVIVPDDQLSLAIGKKGQNVRLAMQLTGWKLDIVTESKILERTSRAKVSLKAIESVNDTLAMGLYQNGYDTFEDVARAEVSELQLVPGLESQDFALQIKQQAQKLVDAGVTTDSLVRPKSVVAETPTQTEAAGPDLKSDEPSKTENKKEDSSKES